MKEFCNLLRQCTEYMDEPQQSIPMTYIIIYSILLIGYGALELTGALDR
jgi:hypothetical protein